MRRFVRIRADLGHPQLSHPRAIPSVCETEKPNAIQSSALSVWYMRVCVRPTKLDDPHFYLPELETESRHEIRRESVRSTVFKKKRIGETKRAQRVLYSEKPKKRKTLGTISRQGSLSRMGKSCDEQI